MIAQISTMEQKYLLSQDILNDPRKIENVALLHKLWQYRKLAVGYISDQQILQTIVETDKVSAVKHAAVQRIHEPQILTEIMLSANTSDIRKGAANQLITANQFNLLLSLFPKIADWWLRTNILQQLPSGFEEKLVEIAIADTNKYVRETAVRKLTNEKLLSSVAIKLAEKDRATAKHAIKQINSEHELLILRMLLPNSLQNELQKQIKLQIQTAEKLAIE